LSSCTRRGFLSTAAVAAAVSADPGAGSASDAARAGSSLDAIETMPNVCAHEHWGSLPAIGRTDIGYVADNVAGATSGDVGLFDLIFDPYLAGFLAAGGFNSNGLARENGFDDIMAMARERPVDVIRAVLPHLADQRSVGTLMCVTLGVRRLHDFDLDGLSPGNWSEIDGRINRAYSDMFGWYRRAMGQCHMSGLIRPAELSFMLEEADATQARRERVFTRPILRIDGFVEHFRRPSDRVRYCMEATGIEPHDAASWRELLGRVFEMSRERGNVGIKQLQAYTRDLDFQHRPDGDIDFAPTDGADTRPFEDFIVHECCRLAHDFGWPFQIHVGTANLPNSSPLPLQALARRYHRAKFVLIHTWPFFDESAFLAHFTPNVYIDTCWLPVLSPSFFEAALRRYLGFVPAHKLMLSHDATSIEMACGSAQLTRTLLRKVLEEHIADGRINVSQALHLARSALHDNAREVYSLGFA